MIGLRAGLADGAMAGLLIIVKLRSTDIGGAKLYRKFGKECSDAFGSLDCHASLPTAPSKKRLIVTTHNRIRTKHGHNYLSIA